MEELNRYFMDVAVKEARKALEIGEVPVGAVLVKDGEILSKGFNLRETSNDITNHAEIIALKKAAEKLGNWKLNGCILYVTLEPCLMCYSAIKQSRIDCVFVGYRGNLDKEYVYRRYVKEDDLINYELENSSSSELLRIFFKNKRSKNDN